MLLHNYWSDFYRCAQSTMTKLLVECSLEYILLGVSMSFEKLFGVTSVSILNRHPEKLTKISTADKKYQRKNLQWTSDFLLDKWSKRYIDIK